MKIKLILTMLLLSILIMCGTCACGKEVNSEDTFGTLEVDGSSYLVHENFPVSEEKLYINKYTPLSLDFSIPDVYNETLHSKTYTTTYEDKLYLLYSCRYHETSEIVYDMHYYDMSMDTLDKIDFSFAFLDDVEYKWIKTIEATGPNEITFIIVTEPDNNSDEMPLLLCKTDSSGQLIEEFHSLENPLSYPLDANLYQIPSGNTYFTEYVAPSGDTTYKNKLFQYEVDTGLQTLIDEFSEESILSLCGDENDMLYFISNNRLISYNLKEKTGEVKCNLRENGVDLLFNICLLRNADGDFALFSPTGERPGIYYFSDEAPGDSESIRLARLTEYGMEHVTQQAGMFYYDKGHYIRSEKEDSASAQEAFRDRIMTEITAGKGPELLWVSEKDLHILAEKGALMDLSTLLSAETTSQLLPGVLQLGTIDNTLYAVTPDVSFEILTVNRTLWAEDSWNTQEMINEAEKQPNLEAAFIHYNFNLPPNMIFLNLFIPTLGDSKHVDLEQGISYFDQQEFIDVLEFCSKYGDYNATQYQKDDYTKLLREGKCISHMTSLYQGMQEYSSAMNIYGDKCHFVGYPVEKGSGKFITTSGYLVVNAQATHLEEIKTFLEYLLSYDRQFPILGTPVRKDVLRDRIITNKYATITNGSPYAITFSNPNNTENPTYADLATKEDGSTYIEEFMDFYEKCEPMPYCPEEIKNMVYEDACAYFLGEKSAQEAADMIHSRIQLYLDEHK